MGQGWKPCPLHWQADSDPLPLGKPDEALVQVHSVGDSEDLIGGHGGDRGAVVDREGIWMVDREGIWMVESNEGRRGGA